MQACTQWTHSDEWSLFTTTLECLCTIEDWQSENKRRNSDRRAMSKATRSIDAGWGVIRHQGVSDGSDRACPLWLSHSARMEMFSADAQPGPMHLGQFYHQSPSISTSQLWLQLSIWVLNASWHDQYVDCAVLPTLAPPTFRFPIQLQLAVSLSQTRKFGLKCSFI
jgi:hypothetical protein